MQSAHLNQVQRFFMLLNLAAYSKDVIDVLESITAIGSLFNQKLDNIQALSSTSSLNRLFELVEFANLNEREQEEDLNSL